MLLDREINEAKLIVQFFNLTGPEKYWKSSMKKGLSWKCCFWKMFDVSFVNKNGHFNNKSPNISCFVTLTGSNCQPPHHSPYSQK